MIDEVERLFCDFGTPQVFKSDNGSQFDIAQSNGLVKRHIQTVKRAILKMLESGKTIYEALAAIRSTYVSSDLHSPSVSLQGRHLPGKLPFIPNRLTPQFIPAAFVLKQL